MALAGVVFAVGSGLVGCSWRSVERDVAAMNDSPMKQLANLYRFYQATHGWVGPKDAATLRAFVQQAPAANLRMMGVDPAKFDELLVSPRDGKPLKVRWGVAIGPMEEQAVVFESEGRDGRRLVVFTSSTAEEVEAARYEELLAGRAVKPAAMKPGGP